MSLRRLYGLCAVLVLLAGVVLAGAVQDFMVLFISSRRNGASLGEMIKQEMGPVPVYGYLYALPAPWPRG